MRIIPAIDIIDGKCVRLTKGDYTQKKIYNENPLDIAKTFEDAGLKYLHLVDLDGAKAGKVINWSVIERINAKTSLTVDFGGGIKTEKEMKTLFDLGVKQVNLGSIAVKQPELVFEWMETFGTDKIIISADVKDEKIQVSGWQENSSISIYDFIEKFRLKRLKYVTCTDINTDGTLTGPNVELYRNMIGQFGEVKWIASGGVSGMNDLTALASVGVEGVIIGKAIYENRITLKELNSVTKISS